MTDPQSGNQPGDWQSQYGQPYDNPYGQYPGGAPTPVPPEVPQPTLAEARFGAFDISDVFSQAWKGFVATWVPWVLSALIFIGVALALLIVMWVPLMGMIALSDTNSYMDSNAAATGFLGISGLFAFLAIIVLIVYSVIWTLNCWRNALRVVRGETIEFKDFFKLAGLGLPFAVSVLVSIVVGIGMILLYLPGIVAAIILAFAVPATFHLRDASVGDAFTASWRMISKNFGNVILLLIIAWALSMVGGLVVVGVLVATPLMHLLYAYALQTSIGGPVARRA